MGDSTPISPATAAVTANKLEEALREQNMDEARAALDRINDFFEEYDGDD